MAFQNPTSWSTPPFVTLVVVVASAGVFPILDNNGWQIASLPLMVRHRRLAFQTDYLPTHYVFPILKVEVLYVLHAFLQRLFVKPADGFVTEGWPQLAMYCKHALLVTCPAIQVD